MIYYQVREVDDMLGGQQISPPSFHHPGFQQGGITKFTMNNQQPLFGGKGGPEKEREL